MPNHRLGRVPVIPELRNHIENLKNQNGGISWRTLQGKIPGWRWSFGMLADLVNGRQESTNPAVYEILGLNPPTIIIQVPEGSSIFGQVGLLDLNQVSVILVMPPDEWQRHSIKCAECGVLCPRWSSTQKYCSRHSWQTKEGRRYWGKK